MKIKSPPQQMLIHATLRIHTIWGVCTLPRAREWRKGARVVWTPRFRRDSSHSEFGGRRGSFGTRPCPPRLLCPWAVCSVPSMPSAHLRHPRLRSQSTQNLEHLLALLAISFHFSKPRLFYAEDTFGPALPLRPFTQTFPGVTVMARFSRHSYCPKMYSTAGLRGVQQEPRSMTNSPLSKNRPPARPCLLTL